MADPIPVEWEGKQYPSIRAAARDNWITMQGMQHRVRCGYTKMSDIQYGGNHRPVTWNGQRYESLTAAAKACGISLAAMWYRLERGYTCNEDLQS